MKGQDIAACDVLDGKLPERRHDVLAKQAALVGDSRGLAVQLDILAHIALGTIGDRRIGFGLKRKLPLLDADDDFGCNLAGLVEGAVAVRADGDPLRAAEGARLDDVPRPPQIGRAPSVASHSMSRTYRTETGCPRMAPVQHAGVEAEDVSDAGPVERGRGAGKDVVVDADRPRHGPAAIDGLSAEPQK